MKIVKTNCRHTYIKVLLKWGGGRLNFSVYTHIDMHIHAYIYALLGCPIFPMFAVFLQTPCEVSVFAIKKLKILQHKQTPYFPFKPCLGHVSFPQ